MTKIIMQMRVGRHLKLVQHTKKDIYGGELGILITGRRWQVKVWDTLPSLQPRLKYVKPMFFGRDLSCGYWEDLLKATSSIENYVE